MEILAYQHSWLKNVIANHLNIRNTSYIKVLSWTMVFENKHNSSKRSTICFWTWSTLTDWGQFLTPGSTVNQQTVSNHNYFPWKGLHDNFPLPYCNIIWNLLFFLGLLFCLPRWIGIRSWWIKCGWLQTRYRGEW